MQCLPFNVVGLSSGIPFKVDGLSSGGRKNSYRNWETSEYLPERNDPDRKLHIEDEEQRQIHSGMSACILAHSGSFEDIDFFRLIQGTEWEMKKNKRWTVNDEQ
jgi:hypothetical protein